MIAAISVGIPNGAPSLIKDETVLQSDGGGSLLWWCRPSDLLVSAISSDGRLADLPGVNHLIHWCRPSQPAGAGPLVCWCRHFGLLVSFFFSAFCVGPLLCHGFGPCSVGAITLFCCRWTPCSVGSALFVWHICCTQHTLNMH